MYELRRIALLVILLLSTPLLINNMDSLMSLLTLENSGFTNPEYEIEKEEKISTLSRVEAQTVDFGLIDL